MASYGESARNKLRALLATNPGTTIGEGFLALAEDVDKKMASWWEGTHAARPSAGQANRFYRETDTGLVFHDTGGIYEQLLTGASIATPIARLAFTLGAPHEPGARVTIVTGDVQLEPTTASGAAVTFYVGGVIVTELFQQLTASGSDSNVRMSFSFAVRPGLSWEGIVTAGKASGLNASYTSL